MSLKRPCKSIRIPFPRDRSVSERFGPLKCRLQSLLESWKKVSTYLLNSKRQLSGFTTSSMVNLLIRERPFCYKEMVQSKLRLLPFFKEHHVMDFSFKMKQGNILRTYFAHYTTCLYFIISWFEGGLILQVYQAGWFWYDTIIWKSDIHWRLFRFD